MFLRNKFTLFLTPQCRVPGYLTNPTLAVGLPTSSRHILIDTNRNKKAYFCHGNW